MDNDEFIDDARLRPAMVPGHDADFDTVIYPFALTYDGYGVWGDQQLLAEVSGRDWERQRRFNELPDSLTKLRTSLFGAARAMRFTDFDEDVFGVPGSESVWRNQMRDLVGAIAAQAERGAIAHRLIAQAVATASVQLMPVAKADERALRVQLGKALAELVTDPVASSATNQEIAFEAMPLWAEADPPGPFDVIVGPKGRPRIGVEAKWSSHNTLSHSLWDILKLLALLALGAEQVYLVAGYPDWVWRTQPFSRLYNGGVLSYTELPLAKEWPSLLREGKGTPLRIPANIRITEVVTLRSLHAGEHWALRVVAIDPAPGGWLRLTDGRLESADPIR